jgi:hypothetical protein
VAVDHQGQGLGSVAAERRHRPNDGGDEHRRAPRPGGAGRGLESISGCSRYVRS